MQKIGLTCATVDGDGDYNPQTGLLQSQFKFVLASDNVTEVTFTGFDEISEGNYAFWGFNVPTFESVAPTNDTYPERYQVRVKINDTFQDGFGNITIYRDDREPVGRGYTDQRLYRGTGAQDPNDGCDTIFGLVQYDDSVNLNDITPTDASLIHKKWADGTYVNPDSDVSWTGAHLFDIAPRVTGTEYVTGNPSQPNTVVWKQWVVDNFASGTAGIPLNVNRLVVDSKASAVVAGKVYTTIQGAIAYASTQTPSASSKWEILIMPHHSTGYAENITLIRFVELIGLGTTIITGSLSTTHGVSQAWTGYDARIENLVFNTTNLDINLKNLKAKDCYFRANGASGEVNLMIDGVELWNCGLFIQNDVNVEINNNVKINRVHSGYGNSNFSWLATDKIYSYDYIESDTWEF